ncbi:MAG: CYTH domain-containing protein [Candidatus Gracilibacteria bacterium]|nr:CYTH domain-containing protein [Candidatus Gracilibacteria bacterium]
MQLEIEKKHNLTKEDYEIIKEKTKFIEEVEIKDYYLDKDLVLAKHNYFLRLRNGIYELKISHFDTETGGNYNEEYDNEDEINGKIKKFGISTDNVTGIMFVDTLREKYEYKFSGQKISIDVDKYQYGERYEIEIVVEIDENQDKLEAGKKGAELIENFIKEIGLTAESNEDSCKTITCAMHQNIDLYEIMTK